MHEIEMVHWRKDKYVYVHIRITDMMATLRMYNVQIVLPMESNTATLFSRCARA